MTVAYNDDGTVNTRTDQRGWTVTYTYDDARRVTAEAISGTGLVGTTAVTYAYDALGRIAHMARPGRVRKRRSLHSPP